MDVKPEMPGTLAWRLPVEAIGVSQYVQELVDYLSLTHERVYQLQHELSQKDEGTLKGKAEGLDIGDYVVLRKEGKDKPKGTRKYEGKSFDEIYQIVEITRENFLYPQSSV